MLVLDRPGLADRSRISIKDLCICFIEVKLLIVGRRENVCPSAMDDCMLISPYVLYDVAVLPSHVT
jgi:hypothetical protein